MSTEPLSSAEVLHASFPGGAVVQLVESAGRAVRLADATIDVTSRRVIARTEGSEWAWLLDDVEGVVHNPEEPWTILSVPGVPDHGVAVPPDAVLEFRRAIDVLGLSWRASRAPSRLPTPPSQPEPLIDPGVAIDHVIETSPSDLREVFSPARTRTVHVEASRLAEDDATGAPAQADGLATLEARSISAWFGTHNVLDRVSLTMHAGQVTALIGPSGCGKSTFLRVLNRMHEMIPAASLSGEVLLDGADIYDASRKLTDARRQIGMVFQKPNPFPAMSIYDNVLASFRLTGKKTAATERDEVVESCLSKAGLWGEVRDRLRQPGGGLSGGQQQRLCIARALAIRPRVLLMDEPCSALDPTSTRRIEQTIVELRNEVTIVIVTHNMQQAARVSNQCAFFLAEAGRPGAIVEHGDTEAMFHSPQDQRTHAYVNGRFG